MELIRQSEAPTFSNSGVESKQLLFPENSASQRLTITRVMMPPGAVNPRHQHDFSEQVWIALEGKGELLLDGDQTVHFSAGDVARFVEGEIHGFRNTGEIPFIYMSVTSPPVNFRGIYSETWGTNNEKVSQ